MLGCFHYTLCGCQSITTARGIKLLTLGQLPQPLTLDHLPPAAFIFTEALGKSQTPPFFTHINRLISSPTPLLPHPCLASVSVQEGFCHVGPTHCEINSCCVTRHNWGCSLLEHAASTPLACHLKPVPGERARTPGCAPSGCGTWAGTGGGRP